MDDTQMPGSDDMDKDNGMGAAEPAPETPSADTQDDTGEDTSNA